jgi:hypothetical protein
MATDFVAPDALSIEKYHRITGDYHACGARCQQAIDELISCEIEPRQAAIAAGDPHLDTIDCPIDGVMVQLASSKFLYQLL